MWDQLIRILERKTGEFEDKVIDTSHRQIEKQTNSSHSQSPLSKTKNRRNGVNTMNRL